MRPLGAAEDVDILRGHNLPVLLLRAAFDLRLPEVLALLRGHVAVDLHTRRRGRLWRRAAEVLICSGVMPLWLCELPVDDDPGKPAAYARTVRRDVRRRPRVVLRVFVEAPET